MKFILLITFFMLFFTSLACDKSSSAQKSISFQTVTGANTVIPHDCSSWEDGCNIYCRCPGDPIGYTKIPIIKCTRRNVFDPVCIDSELVKRQKCYTPEAQMNCSY